jgi:integrase
MRLSEITPPKLEVMLTDIVRDNDLSEKCTKNLLSCVRQAFRYARRSGFITKDAFECVDVEMLLSNCKETIPRQDRILTKSEMERLYRVVREKELLYPYYMPNYCVELAMYTGMRVGEISALHWGDVRDKLYIDYSEHRLDYRDKPSEIIISEPKNRKHRAIPITDEIRDLFDRVRALEAFSDEGFIFVRPDGRRYTGHDIGCATARRAREAGIDNTSIHEIRRTVSSLLNTKLSRRDVSDMLGHSEQVNERFYNYSTSEDAEKIDALRDVIQSYSPCF